MKTVTKPKLLISGDQDDISPTAKLKALIDDSPAPKTLVIVDGADHFFGGLEHRVAEAAAAFLAE